MRVRLAWGHEREPVHRSPAPAIMNPEPLVVVLGPTASGKSEIAVRLAERFGGEVVGCDSMQVYRGFDAGTGKPPAELLARVPHHLIGTVDPSVDFSLGDYVRAAGVAIASIASAHRMPVVAGGTGLYLRGLLRGVFEGPRRDEALRARILAIGARRGGSHLHRLLDRVDPASARRLAPRDRQRIVRALEVFFASGRPLSRHLEEHSFVEERWRAVKIGLSLPRRLLGARIEKRVDQFLASGWEEEVRRLIETGVPETANAWKALGYRSVLRLVRGEIDRERAREQIVQDTRRYAKRQMTWFRREPGVVWFEHEGDPPWDPIERLVGRAL